MSELKPCPFCGGEAESWKLDTNPIITYRVYCIKCGCEGKPSSGERHAIQLWNTRTPSDREQKLVEALRFYATAENWKWVAKATDTNHILDCGSEVQRDFGERARNTLSAYDTPDSQGEQNTARIKLPGIRQQEESYDSSAFPPASRTGLPNNCEGSVPPLSEEEAVEIMNLAFITHGLNHGVTSGCVDVVLHREYYRALAKRLGWM